MGIVVTALIEDRCVPAPRRYIGVQQDVSYRRAAKPKLGGIGPLFNVFFRRLFQRILILAYHTVSALRFRRIERLICQLKQLIQTGFRHRCNTKTRRDLESGV